MKNEELDRIIELAAETSPEFQLPDDFALKVTRNLEQHLQWKNNLLEYFYLSALTCFLFSICVGLYYYIDKQIVINLIPILSQNIIPIAGIALLLNFVLFSDKVLLPLLFSRWNRI